MKLSIRRFFFLCAIFFAVFLIACTTSGNETAGGNDEPEVSSEYVFKKAAGRAVHVNMGMNGGVASGGPMGPSIGLKVLMDGGNAIDAAITAAVMSTVTQYSMSSIGGHGNMIIYLAKTNEVKFLDWGGSMPAAFTIDQWGTPPSEPAERSVANTIFPGTLKGWDVALRTYGTISLADALAPAIKYAEEGFPIYSGWAQHMASIEDELEIFPEFKEVVYPEGRPPREGELLRFPDLANTYKRIAREGSDVFYKGELARQVVNFLNENGSRFTLEEFANYQPQWVDMLKTTYRGEYEIYVPKNQNFNPVILTMFNIWENFDLPNMNPMAADTLHIIIEASKVALNDRIYYGDPAFSSIPYDILTSKAYGNALAGMIKMDSVLPDTPGGDLTGLVKSAFAQENNRSRTNTTSIAAVDKEGNVALITQTIGSFNGSMHIVPGTGIILNNEGIFFDLNPPNGPNYPEAGKKVENQMGGAIVLKNGKFFAGAATPGGWQIPLQIAQVLERIIDYDLAVQQAIEAPRFAYTGGGTVRLEADISAGVRDSLQRRGHILGSNYAASRMVGVKIDPAGGAKQVGADPGWPPSHSVAY